MAEVIRTYRQKSYEKAMPAVDTIRETVPDYQDIGLPPMTLPPLRPSSQDLPGRARIAEDPSQPNVETDPLDAAMEDLAGRDDPLQPHKSPSPPANDSHVEGTAPPQSPPQLETEPDTTMKDVAGSHDALQPHCSPSPSVNTTRVEDTGQFQEAAIPGISTSLLDTPANHRSVPPSPAIPTTLPPSLEASRHVTPAAPDFDDPPTSQLTQSMESARLQWHTDRSILDADFDSVLDSAFD